MGFPGYFLIVADFIKWAKATTFRWDRAGVPAPGSLVAYSLTITDLDPLRFGLLFERFLNPERVSMPDFDIDFCQERREEVIDLRPAALRQATGWRRSSPSAPCRRAPCCATSAG
jgi:DNA polymerase-3 subunit alpha